MGTTAIERELARRRRNNLLRSIRVPHSETSGLVDTNLADWTADLPDDQGLVDPTAGTAVRWVEGRDWTKEPA